jgi:hypothetical protein
MFDIKLIRSFLFEIVGFSEVERQFIPNSNQQLNHISVGVDLGNGSVYFVNVVPKGIKHGVE